MSHLLDEKILETLTYERSKTWSNFLKICEVNDNDNDIPLNKLEEVYKDQNEDDLDAIEEAEEEDVEDDIKSTTMGMSKAELTLMLRRGDNKEILYQTLPIVEQHVRKWKEAGLDRILNTFDAQKIERHVGDWLRRHNSAYGDKNLIQPSLSKPCHKRHKANSGVDLYSSAESGDSATESNHSFDTAHYVCECRKCRVSNCRKCSDPMGTIGRYCKTPRKCAMYRCDEFSQVQDHQYMQALIQRCVQRKRDHERKLRYHSMQNPHNYELNLNGQKYLRKPRNLSIMYSSSSSSDDDRRDSRCMCSPCLRRTIPGTAHPCYAYRSYQSHSPSYRDYHHRRLASCRSIHSNLSYKRSVKKLRRQHAFEEDPLCSNGGYNVISTDELFVPKSSISHMIDKKNISLKNQFSRKKQTSTRDLANPSSTSGFIPKNVPVSIGPPMNNKIKAVDEVRIKGNLKVSDQKEAAKDTPSSGRTMCKKRNREQYKTKKKTNSTKFEDSDIELKKALEISKKTYLKEQEKFRQWENSSNITSEASTSLQLPEKSSFSNQSVACNSTTVFNRTDKPRSQNPIQVATIIELSSSYNSVAEQGRRTKIHSKRDVECTSTTGCEEAGKQSETTVVTQRSDIKITKNGILLYAPKQVATGKQAHQNYTLTEQSLSPIIGERRARRFLKYHVGSRSFDSRYSVYYRPTARVVAMLSGESKSLNLNSSSSSGSEVDIFEQVDRYGVVNTVLE